MKTVVTIDFDIIMAPSIQMYNNMTNIPWDERRNISPHFNLLTLDGNNYQKLMMYILSLTEYLTEDQIYIIHTHENLLNILPKDEEISLINIDHHHDIEYEDKIEKIITCGNWVKQLYNLNLCKSYFWINNSNSMPPKDELKHFLTKSANLQNYDLNNILNTDYLILCLSNPWVPPEYQPLFLAWLDVLNKIYDTHFDFID